MQKSKNLDFWSGCGGIFLWMEDCVKEQGGNGHEDARVFKKSLIFRHVVFMDIADYSYYNDYAVHVLIYKKDLWFWCTIFNTCNVLLTVILMNLLLFSYVKLYWV